MTAVALHSCFTLYSTAIHSQQMTGSGAPTAGSTGAGGWTGNVAVAPSTSLKDCSRWAEHHNTPARGSNPYAILAPRTGRFLHGPGCWHVVLHMSGTRGTISDCRTQVVSIASLPCPPL